MANLVDEPPQRERSVSAERTTRKKTRFGLILLVVLLVLAAVGVWVYFHFQGRVSTDDATVDGHVTSVAPKISGNVTEVLVLDNQPVQAGQVLVRIDPRDYQAKVDQAKAALLQAESQAQAAEAAVPLASEQTQSGVSAATAQLTDARAEEERARIGAERAASADLEFAQANVRTRQANRDKAEADLARMRPLSEKDEISKLQFDAYVAAARVADNELKAAQEQLTAAQRNAEMQKAAVGSAAAKVKQAQAQLEGSQANRKQVPIRKAESGTASAAVQVARANLAAAELNLSYTTITASVAGVVTHKSVEVGQIVAPGQNLMAVIPLNDVWVTANFKETQLAEVHAGEQAEISVDMYGKKVNGHVDSIAGATGSRLSLLPPENATGNFVKVVQRIPVKILVDPQQNLVLRPGMNVDVTIFTK